MNWLLFAQNAGDAGSLFVGVGILWLLLGIVALGIWIWALVDAIQNPALDNTMRIVWILVILFTQVLGAIIYLVVGRSRRTAGGA